MISALSLWTPRRWWTALGVVCATALVIAIPTALIPNPVFGRDVPPTPWAWPVLLATAVLSGLLVATYVREPGVATAEDNAGRTGGIGGLLAYFAVGCPVCNKLALIALGYSGSLQWFAPMQPWLAAAGIVLLAWALRTRLRGEAACPVTPASTEPRSATSMRR